MWTSSARKCRVSMCFKKHINQLTKSWKGKLALKQIRHTLPRTPSIMDYGDVIYIHSPAFTLKLLNAVYHSTLRFITGDGSFFQMAINHCDSGITHIYSMVYFSFFFVISCFSSSFIWEGVPGKFCLYCICIIQYLCIAYVCIFGLFLLSFVHRAPMKTKMNYSHWSTLYK